MQFSKDEIEQLDRLRNKYAGKTDTLGNEDQGPAISPKSDVAAPPCQPLWQQSTAGLASNVSVTVCTTCQGTGIRFETYNYRRLEATCEHCEGQGVHVAKLAAAGAGQGQQGTAGGSHAGGSERGTGSSSTTINQPGGRIRQSPRVQALEQRLEVYQKENKELKAAMATSAPGLYELQLQLLEQLQQQIRVVAGALDQARMQRPAATQT